MRGQIGEQGLNLSRSQQQGYSAAYNTPFKPSRLQVIYPFRYLKLRCDGEHGGTESPASAVAARSCGTRRLAASILTRLPTGKGDIVAS